VLWCVRRPAHVNIQDVVLYPTDQAAPTIVSRHNT
jgi:NADP-dependent 3-hydroxy acid dehydrogenase YdfG